MKSFYRVVMVTVVLITISAFIPLTINQGTLPPRNICYGSGFIMEMNTDNSAGITKRLIDISSPFSGAYLYENVTVVGRSEITDSFEMNNINPGSGIKAERDIDDTFGSGLQEMDIFDDKNSFDDDIYPGTGPKNSSDSVTVISPSSGLSDSTDGRAEDFFKLSSHSTLSWLEMF